MCGLERCQSGRMGHTANVLIGLNRSEGSNPSLSAKHYTKGICKSFTIGSKLRTLLLFCLCFILVNPPKVRILFRYVSSALKATWEDLYLFSYVIEILKLNTDKALSDAFVINSQVYDLHFLAFRIQIWSDTYYLSIFSSKKRKIRLWSSSYW